MEGLTQTKYGKVATAGIGLGMSVATYFLTKNTTLRLVAISAGAWSALAVYEAWSQAAMEEKLKARIEELSKKKEVKIETDGTSKAQGLNGPNATRSEIAALEQAIKKLDLDLSGSTGLPDPDLNGGT